MDEKNGMYIENNERKIIILEVLVEMPFMSY